MIKKKNELGMVEGEIIFAFFALSLLLILGLLVSQMGDIKEREEKITSYINNYIHENKNQECIKMGTNDAFVNNEEDKIIVLVNDCILDFSNPDNIKYDMINYNFIKYKDEVIVKYTK